MLFLCVCLQTKGNKKHSSSKLKDLEELVSYVPASKLSNPVYAGYCEVLLMGSWNRYWCVVHTGCLYLYTNQESQATIRTIVLKGQVKYTSFTMYTYIHVYTYL